MNWLGKLVQKEISPDDTVLDVGCAIMAPISDVYYHEKTSLFGSASLKCKTLVGVDIWKPYLDRIKHKYIVVLLDLNSPDAMKIFVDRSFDVVIALDSLEHIHESRVWSVVDHMERIAKKKVIIYTPRQFASNKENINDSFLMGENIYQQHYSFLAPDVLRSRGYTISYPEPDKNTFAVKIL